MTLHVHEFGPADGRPLVVLHGITGHGGRWRLFAQRQLADFRVLAPDLRGHGDSTRLPPWTLEQHAADVLDVLDMHGLDRAPLVGHSYGGAIALRVAAVAPERVERLALLDPAIGLPALDCQDAAESEFEPEWYADLDEARADQESRWEGVPAEAVDLEVPVNFTQAPDGRWRRRYSSAMAVTGWSELSRPAVLPPASLPTLLVPAAKADFVTPTFVAAMRDRLGDRLTVAEVDSGHMVYLERPEEVGGLLTRFL
jgi:lipase